MSADAATFSWPIPARNIAAPVFRQAVHGPYVVRRGGGGWLNPLSWIVYDGTCPPGCAQPTYGFMFRWSAQRFARRLNAGGRPARAPDWV